jgi:hypothetical protein
VRACGALLLIKITYRGMETFPIVVVFYPYPKIVQQLLWITDQTIKDLKFIF